MNTDQLALLEPFIIRAKAATYVGSGAHLLPYRLGSHDLQFHDGDWSYHDSYFGGSDFMGQEVVYYRNEPVWGMNYFGRLLTPERITAAEIGQMIKKSLTRMYAESRFLGGFEHVDGSLRYVDRSEGDVFWFEGVEVIYLDGELVYRLPYHGGLIHP